MKEISRFDVHHHILPPEVVTELKEMGIDSGLGVPLPEWSPEKSLKFMKKNKITHAVVSTGIPVTDLTVLKELTRLCNVYTKELKEEYPTTFGGLATLPLPDVRGAITELKYALDKLKLDGVAFFTHYNGKYLGCKEFDEVFKELNSRKAVVLIHPIDPPIAYDSGLTMPNALIEVHSKQRELSPISYTRVRQIDILIYSIYYPMGEVQYRILPGG